MLYVFVFLVIVTFLVAKQAMMISFSEIFNPSLSKIDARVNKLIKKGYNANITYLYFKGTKKDIQKNFEVFMEIIDYLSDLYKDETDIFKKGKVSLKMIQLGMTYEEKFENLMKLLNYAQSKNIFVWISSFHYKNVQEECSTYLNLLERGYKNIGITIACYHRVASIYVDIVLARNGHIRLVKGYYNDGQIKDWDQVTKNYLENAKKIVKSPYYHQIATHDFKNVLKPLNDIKKLESLQNKEFGFFINATKHVERETKKYGIKLPMKCVLITFGKKFRYIRSNLFYISYARLLRVKNII